MSIGCEHTIFHDVRVKGFWLAQRLLHMPAAQCSALIMEAVDLLAQGVLHADIAGTFSLDDIGEAIGLAEAPGRRGKVCLLPNGPVDARTRGA